MKKCPFCAESIQDEAIKCRYCQSFLSAAPKSESESESESEAEAESGSESGAESEAGPGPEVESARPELSPAVVVAAARSAARKSRKKEEEQEDDSAYQRKVLYSGSPSWRAFVREYTIITVLTIAVPLLTYWIFGKADASGFTRFLAVAIPLVMGALALFALHIYRTSKVFRVTTTNIEFEYGVLSKKIDVLELWRCRDVRYQQSLVDRILGIAHIEIFTTDVTTPQLNILGLPASRQLFEKIRDSIEIQRQARHVVGVVQ